MVEVFKTNVKDSDQAKMLTDLIHKDFPAYKVNFDLDDCDNILRVESNDAVIDDLILLGLIKSCGFDAAVLPDVELPENKNFFQQSFSSTR